MLQHGVERRHSKEQSFRLIADYTNTGGDGGITMKHMRGACNLPQQDRTVPARPSQEGVEAAPSLPPGIDLQLQEVQPHVQPTPESAEDPCRAPCIAYLLSKKHDALCRGYCVHINIPRKSGKKDALWAAICDSPGWMKQEASTTKGKAGICQCSNPGYSFAIF